MHLIKDAQMRSDRFGEITITGCDECSPSPGTAPGFNKCDHIGIVWESGGFDGRDLCQMALERCPPASQRGNREEGTAPVPTKGRPETFMEHVAAQERSIKVDHQHAWSGIANIFKQNCHLLPLRESLIWFSA